MVTMLAGAVLIFAVCLTSTAFGSLRVRYTLRGQENIAAAVGFMEVLCDILAVGLVLTNYTNMAWVVGYAAGFGLGTVAGIRIDQALAAGFVTLNVTSHRAPRDVADELRNGGFGATLSWREAGINGIGIIATVIPRRSVGEALQLVASADTAASVDIDDVQSVQRGWMPVFR